MALFIKKETKPACDKFNAVLAKEIYSGLESGKSETDLFKEGVCFCCTDKAIVEMKRLESEINVIMSDIANQPATQNDLVALLSSELLDVAVVVNDVRRYAD